MFLYASYSFLLLWNRQLLSLSRKHLTATISENPVLKKIFLQAIDRKRLIFFTSFFLNDMLINISELKVIMGFSQKTRKRFTTFFFILLVSVIFALVACFISIPIRGCGPQVFKKSENLIKERKRVIYEKVFGYKPPSNLRSHDTFPKNSDNSFFDFKQLKWNGNSFF